jgi:hypothetical protein
MQMGPLQVRALEMRAVHVRAMQAGPLTSIKSRGRRSFDRRHRLGRR